MNEVTELSDTLFERGMHDEILCGKMELPSTLFGVLNLRIDMQSTFRERF